jgi:hypothetical protein
VDEYFDQEKSSVVSCMFTLTTSATCHSRTHSQVRIENDLEKPKKRKGVAHLGALDCPVVPLAAGPRAPESKPSAPRNPRANSSQDLIFCQAPDCPVRHQSNG